MIDARLIEVRKAVKRRKPNFKIQNSNDPAKRFAGRWKRPKGLQSKMRERRKGNPKSVEPGYGSPEPVRGTTPDGFFPVVVKNISELANIQEGCGVVISAGVGMLKRAAIAKAAIDKKLKPLNFKADEISTRLSESVALRKKRRLEIMQRRKVKGEAKKPSVAATTAPSAKPSADIEGKVDVEEKKKAEKAEKDKILTKAK